MAAHRKTTDWLGLTLACLCALALAFALGYAKSAGHL